MPLRLDGIPLERTYFRLPARLRSTHTCEMLLTCSYSYRSHFKLTASKSQSTGSSPELPICELVRRPSGLRQVFRVVAQTEDFISCLCSTGMIWVVALIEVGVVGTTRDIKKKDAVIEEEFVKFDVTSHLVLANVDKPSNDVNEVPIRS